jgi:hypothetical protein
MLFRHLPSLNRHLALRLALGLALASALPQSVSGQVGLTRGDHVRVRFGNEHAYSFGDREETSISGEVVSTLGGELVLRRSERLTRIPLSDVRSIKKRTGRRAPSGPDMVASSTVGFGIGFLAGALLEAAARRNTWPEAETTAVPHSRR